MLSKKLTTVLVRAAEARQARARLELIEGEVVAVGEEAGCITLAHAGIPSLSLPPMTMVFATKYWIQLDSGRKVIDLAALEGLERSAQFDSITVTT